MTSKEKYKMLDMEYQVSVGIFKIQTVIRTGEYKFESQRCKDTDRDEHLSTNYKMQRSSRVSDRQAGQHQRVLW